MDPKNGEQKPKSGITGFFSKPLGITLLVLLAFVIGNVWGVTGRINLVNVGSSNKSQANAGLPDNLDYTSVEDVYDKLRDNYDGKLTEDQLLTGLKKGLAEATGDPYTEYFTAQKAKEFVGSINNSFSGVGAELGKDKDGNLIVVAPIAGFPAEKAGLKAQDIITNINGVTTSNMSVDDAVSKIRGEKGTKVTLKIIRNRAEQLEFTITRENIQIKSVKWEVQENNIGYISINTFANDTPNLVRQAADELKDKNVKGIVLDLRGNPGGILDSAVAVASQWLPRGTKVLEEKRGSVVLKTYESDGPGQLKGIPTVILIDEGSASASEITAGALKDNGAARLIGQKSYGKGVVQQPICISGGQAMDGSCGGDMLKVTVASWYRPNGQNINHQGIKPDQDVKLSEDDAKAGKDTQKDAAIQYLLSKQ